MRYKVSDGSWAAWDCRHCGIVYKSVAVGNIRKLARSNIDSHLCDTCGQICTVIWGKFVSSGKDIYFLPEGSTAPGPKQGARVKKDSQP